jgi:hypothetical protein
MTFYLPLRTKFDGFSRPQGLSIKKSDRALLEHQLEPDNGRIEDLARIKTKY